MIAVICRNGEHRTIDPREIERVESVPDTVVHMVNGRTYVLDSGLDEVLTSIRDSYAELLVVQKRMAGGTAELADSAAHLRVERRARARVDDSPGSPAERRPVDGPPEA